MKNGHGTIKINILGVYTYPNGDKYDGEWKDDKKSDRGNLK